MSVPYPVTLVGDIASKESGSIAIGPFGSAMKSDLYVDHGIPVIRGNNIGSGRSIVGEFVNVSAETASRLKRSILQPGDLFFPHRGAIGEVGILCGAWDSLPLMSSSLMRLRVDTDLVDPDFAFWYFKSSDGRHEILRFASTVGTPGIGQPLTSLRAMRLPLPPLAAQREIAGILGTLDDKIELNRKTAATLEEMARALYRSWFVDFDPVRTRAEGRAPAHMDAATAALFPDSFGEDGLPEGWEIVEAQQEIEVAIGKTPPRKEPEHFVESHGGVRWLSIRDMGNCGVFTEVTAEGLAPDAVKKFNVAIAPRGTVLLSFKLTVGRLAIASDDICTNEAIAHMKIASRSRMRRYFLYSALKAFDFDSLASTSSIATAVNSKTIKKMPLLRPSAEAIQAFESYVQPWFGKVFALTTENRTLATLRDTLLPRLMSGELRVGAARELIEEVA